MKQGVQAESRMIYGMNRMGLTVLSSEYMIHGVVGMGYMYVVNVINFFMIFIAHKGIDTDLKNSVEWKGKRAT